MDASAARDPRFQLRVGQRCIVEMTGPIWRSRRAPSQPVCGALASQCRIVCITRMSARRVIMASPPGFISFASAAILRRMLCSHSVCERDAMSWWKKQFGRFVKRPRSPRFLRDCGPRFENTIGFERRYRTKMFNPVGVVASPIFTEMGWVPDTPAGIVTFNCKTPETNPGAAPA